MQSARIVPPRRQAGKGGAQKQQQQTVTLMSLDVAAHLRYKLPSRRMVRGTPRRSCLAGAFKGGDSQLRFVVPIAKE